MTKFYVAAHGIICKDGKFLITRRSSVNDYLPLFWDVPGGSVDPGESVEDTLAREVSEETGLIIRSKQVLHIYSNCDQLPVRQTFQIVLCALYLNGEVRLNPEEHDEFRWVTLDEIADLELIPFLKSTVQALRDNAFAPE